MPYEQPERREGAPSFTDGNDVFAHDLATGVREIFAAYQNRDASDNRGAQRHLGPSEIGTACDRRLAMSLLGIPPVNPGGDSWAAWVGTCGHAGLASIFELASGRSGRFDVETKLNFPSKLVPKGTADLLDRRLNVLIDHKFQGTWALKHLREHGPSQTYRVQLHTYGYGATVRGEKIERVALVAWPRQGNSLDELFVWSEPYDKQIALDALARVEEISVRLAASANAPTDSRLRPFAVADDCRYCSFHLKGSNDLSHACNGRQ